MGTFTTTFYGNANMVTAVMFLLTGYLRVPRCMKLSWGIFARLILELPCIIHDKQPGFECAAPLHGATEAVLDCWSCISTSALHMVELLIDCTIAALSLYHSGNPDFSRMTFAQKHRGGLAFAHFVQSLFLRLFKMTASQIAMANCIKLAKAKSSKFHARMHFFAVCTFLPVE